MLNQVDIKNDLFVLGIQTHEQQKLFEKGAAKIYCIDVTHKTNRYDFSLVTVLVPDEFGKGYPVRFFISNRTDELVLRHFFEEIRKRTGDLKVKCMHDR